jgi:hypothetical protein
MLATRSRRLTLALLWGLVLPLSGGCSFGPKVLENTHGRYNESVRRVQEEQLLRNIVHVRYTEFPAHLNVGSIAAQYELASTGEARPFFLAPNPSGNTFKTFTNILPDLSVATSNRPTITLDPADGSQEVRQFLTAIPPDTLLFLVQSGWPVSTVLRLWVERLNGVPNAVVTSGPLRDAPVDFARFLRIAELLQSAQDQELITVRAEEHTTEVGSPRPAASITAAAEVDAARNGLEYRPRGDGQLWVLVRRERRLVVEITPGAEQSPEVTELIGLLHLVPGRMRYELVMAARGDVDPARFPTPPSPVLRVVTRSSAQVLFYLANGVEVPPKQVEAGLVHLPVDAEGRPVGPEVTRGLFQVRTCKGLEPPKSAYVAVKYRGWWYYLDDSDQQSKATFALVLGMSRLDFARQRIGTTGPVLTLPAGR